MTDFNHDINRENRLGFPEMIYGRSKRIDHLIHILDYFSQKKSNTLITKLQPEKATVLKEQYPDAFYDKSSGIFILKPLSIQPAGKDVAIVSAGTSDEHIVNEVFYTLAFLNIWADVISDVGVAGIHRLMEKMDRLKAVKVLIVVAGFEGLLPSVVAGMCPQPVIAVPSDVGYGVAEGGKTALNSMLASCANGITVTNISNGYGAAMAAFRILNVTGSVK